MRIAVVSFAGQCRAGEADGWNSPALGLTRALRAAGHEPVLYVRRQGSSAVQPLASDGCELVELTAGPDGELADREAVRHVGEFVRRLGPALASARCDVVHSHGWLAGLAVHLAVPRPAWPLVHTLHRSGLLDRPGRAAGLGRVTGSQLRAEQAVARRADQLIAATAAGRDALVEAGVRRDRVRVIPHGVSTRPDPDDPERPVDAGASGKRVVVFGSADEAARAIWAATALRNVEFVLVAGAWDRHTVDELGALADRLQVAGRIRVARVVDASGRIRLVRSASVVACLPSADSCGLEHLEAMALGVPVLAGSRHARATVIDKTTGVVLVDSAPRALAKSLWELLASPTHRLAVGVAGRDHVLSRHGWDRIADETVRTYHRAIECPTPERPASPEPGARIAPRPLADGPGERRATAVTPSRSH